jgi:hypothetical protein
MIESSNRKEFYNMQARLEFRKFPTFLVALLFALAAALVVGGALGYALRSPIAVQAPARVVIVHDGGDMSPNANVCLRELHKNVC